MIRPSILLAALLWPAVVPPVDAMDHVVFRRDGNKVFATGRLIVQAEDGGLLLLATDGVLWAVQPDELVEHKQDDQPYKPVDRDETARRLLQEMPAGFQVYTTAHYVICYNTSKTYAQWCGALYERLYRGFSNFWTHRGFDLHEPESPLVALVFKDKESYARYAKSELGESAHAIIGYYSLATNRVTMYNLTGIDAPGRRHSRLTSAAQINRVLSSPEALRTVATIVHEATHQMAFNCGLQQRWSEVPMWVSEGIAVYFETPDLKRSKGWSTIGAVNRPRLYQFRQYLRRRPADSLETLLADDTRLREAETALDAYAEAWALNYYLLRHRSEQYVQYLKMLAEKKPLVKDQPAERLKQFTAIFGDDLGRLDAEFLRKMQRVK